MREEPYDPEVLANALQDNVHQSSGKGRAAGRRDCTVDACGNAAAFCAEHASGTMERDELREEVSRLRAMADRRRVILDWLGVSDEADLCRRCHGRGQRAYGSATTWRGGIGGQAVTQDVCNMCWGTGVKARTGENLKKLFVRIAGLERKSRP